MTTIAKLITYLGVDSAQFNRELDKSGKKGKQFGDDLGKSLAKGAAALGAATVAAGGAMAVLTARSIDNQDAAGKVAEKLGLATEGLTRLRYAGELTGVSNDKLDMSLQRMTRRLAEAARGGGEAQNAIKELGLDAQQLSASSPDKAFRQIAAAMADVPSQADRVRLAFKFFDSEGVDLVRTLSLGADGLDKMAQESDALGLTIHDSAAFQAARFNDTLTRLKGVGQGVVNQFSVQMLPALNDVATGMFSAAKQANETGNSVNFVANSVRSLAATIFALKGGMDSVFVLFERGGESIKHLFIDAIGGAVLTVSTSIGRLAQAAFQFVTGNFSAAAATIRQSAVEVEEGMRSAAFGWQDSGAALMKIPGDIAAETQEAATRIVDLWDTAANQVSQNPIAPSMAGAAGSFDPNAAANEADAKARQGRLDSLLLTLRNERQIIQDEQMERLALLERGLADGLITEQTYSTASMEVKQRAFDAFVALNEREAEEKLLRREQELEGLSSFLTAKLGLEQEHASLLTSVQEFAANFESQSIAQRFSGTLGLLQKFGQAGAKQSRKMFELSKLAAIASALVGAKESVVTAYAWGSKFGGPPLGAVFAGVAGLAQAKNVSSLRGQSFSAGGSVSGASGGVPSLQSSASLQRSPDAAGAVQSDSNRQPLTVNVNIPDDELGVGAVAGLSLIHI